MSAELAGRAYVEMSVKGREDFAKAFASMQASVQTFAAKLSQVKAAPNSSAMSKFFRSAKKEFSDLVGIATKYGTIVGAAVGATTVAVLSQAIHKASDLQETMNKFNVVFGNNAAEMEAWGTTFAKQMGRSKQQVMEFMSNAQGLIIPMGVDPGQAQEMSKTLTQLSFDLASFHNSTDAEAFDALRSALTGESEPMKKFGVIVNETAVKAELLKKGLDPTTANEAQKAMARYNIILEGTRQAQGDVERSGDSFANRLKALQASWDDLSAQIGTAFLPIASALLGWFKELVESLGVVDGATGQAAAGIEGLGSSSEIATTAAGYLVKAWAGVDLAFNLVMGTARTLMRDLMYLFKLMINNPLSKGVFGKQAIDDLVAIVDEVDAATAKLQETNRQHVEDSWNTLMDPKAGEKAVANVQDFIKNQNDKYKQQTEAIKKAREEAKNEAANAKPIEQPGLRAMQELAAKMGGTPVPPSETPDATNKRQAEAASKASSEAAKAGDAAGKSVVPSYEKALQGATQDAKDSVQGLKDKSSKVALANMETIKDLHVGQPAEAGAAKPDKAKEAKQAKDELAAKTVEVANPQTLESTSLAAFEKFRENANNEQKALLEKQLATQERMRQALENPDLVLAEVD